VGHSRHYDAEVVYVNHAFERLGGMPSEAVVGRSVRELFPYVEEEWYHNVRRAANDGETVELDYTDPLTMQPFHFKAWQVMCPGYCAVAYTKA
jgi:PAS domain-containing protein